MTCGCKIVNDKMGDSRNITLDDVIESAKVQKITFKQVIINFLGAIPLAIKVVREQKV
jgi:hypothetical protein